MTKQKGWADSLCFCFLGTWFLEIWGKTLERVLFFLFLKPKTEGGRVMLSYRDAIQILWLSPIYWQLTVPQRWELIREYCQQFNEIAIKWLFFIKNKIQEGEIWKPHLSNRRPWKKRKSMIISIIANTFPHFAGGFLFFKNLIFWNNYAIFLEKLFLAVFFIILSRKEEKENDRSRGFLALV